MSGLSSQSAALINFTYTHYVLALKGNQGDLHADVVQLFQTPRAQKFKNIEHQFYTTVETGHGRIETRRRFSLILGEKLQVDAGN